MLCVDKYFDFFVIGMVGEGKYLCVLFDGNNILWIWNLNKVGYLMISEVYIENYRVYKDNFVLIVFFLFDEWILYVLRGVNCVFVNNVWNGK